MEDTVTILMATFNGENYLVEQLESLISQTYSHWNLFIRDDGSKDKTLSILESYCIKDTRIHLLESNTHLGPVGNFGALMDYAKNSLYIMFCDQDDIWIPEKIEISLTQMKLAESSYNKKCPLLLYTGKEIVNQNLNIIKVKKKIYKNCLSNFLSQNHIYGCTIIINNALINFTHRIPDYAQNHDYWLILNASLYGKIIPIKENTIFYRQHLNNVTGGLNNFSIIKKIKNWKRTNCQLLKTIEQNLAFCSANLETKNNTLVQYLNIFTSTKIKRLMKAVKFGIHTDSLLGTLRLYYVIWKFNPTIKGDFNA